MRVVIIGGVAGGATAAARLRRLDEQSEIIILERSGYISYANCGLPYYIGGVIKERASLTLQTPESFKRRFNIDVRVKNEALRIDRQKKEVAVRRLEDGTEYTLGYDKLILAPGAKAIRPNLPGVDDSRVMTLRTVEDTYKIREYIEGARPKKAAVIGGGFIGLEMAENLIGLGIDTTLIQLDPQVLLPLDMDMASQVHAYLRDKGLKLMLGAAAESFEDTGNGLTVHIKDRPDVETDVVIMAVGVAPDSSLAKDCGLELGQRGAIAVDRHMRTSDPDIYAVGDAVETYNMVTGERATVALAGPANKQGRIAADSICGIASAFAGAAGSSVVKLFEMTVASTGLNERAAKAAGIDYDKVINFSANHATYYPGAENMTIKTIFEKSTGRILGAQIIGFDGVDKRIDVMATAIYGKMTGFDLTKLDLAYAPPYSSAKDPVNMAGFNIENVLTGKVRQYQWYELESISKDHDAVILDVRTEREFSCGHIPGAVNIPVDSLRDRLGELSKDKKLYVNCQSGLRSYIACRILSQEGFQCWNLAGGYRFYEYVVRDRAFDSTPSHPCGIEI